jgi:hypothetical protein
MYGLVHASHPEATLTTVGNSPGSEGVIKLAPVLLRKGDEWTVEAVVGGEPTPEIDSRLIDTAIIRPTNRAELALEVAGAIGAFPLPLPGGTAPQTGGKVLRQSTPSLAPEPRREHGRPHSHRRDRDRGEAAGAYSRGGSGSLTAVRPAARARNTMPVSLATTVTGEP